jgi:hypothetical protein
MADVELAVSARSVSWIASLGIALLAGLTALGAGGVVAAWCVDWYRISSFEGNSGYFVVFMALLSGIAGTIVGLVVARVVASAPAMNGFKALGWALAIVLAVAGGVAGGARFLADVPPEIDGETLHLLIELRWPGGQRPPAGAGTIRLGTLSGRTLRAEEVGPLFLDDARLDGTQWIVPGAVAIFTSRGTPVISAFAGSTQITSLLPPLPRYPRQEHLQWSDWQAATPEGRPVIGTPVTYRFRVSPRSEPVRWQAVGPLTVETRVSSVFQTDDADALSAQSTFVIRYHDRIVPGLEDATALAVVSPAPLALLARSPSTCRLVTMTANGPVAAEAPPCDDTGPSWRLETGAARTVGLARAPRGWLDRDSFKEPGLYLLGPALLDTRALTVVARGWPNEPNHDMHQPPLGLSPDRRTLAWFSPGNGYDQDPVLATMRLDTGRTSTLPIDRLRMRYRTPVPDIDSAWLAHHFEWVRGDDGVEQLHARRDFVPLPHRGSLSPPKPGEYQAYDLGPGGRRLQAAVVDILVAQLHGIPIEEEYATVNTPRVAIDGVPISVQYVEGDAMVSVHSFKSRPDVMARVAAHLDGVLASGQLDALLVEEPR